MELPPVTRVPNPGISNATGLQAGTHSLAMEMVKLAPIEIKNGDSSITLYPGRGGIVTSLRLRGREVLYQGMLDGTLSDPSKSVKGGVPILFPNAGPLTADEKEQSGYSLPQHGFARNNPWKITERGADYIEQTLASDDIFETHGFLWKGAMNNKVAIGENLGDFYYQISNHSNKDLPISWGLHPYFDVPEGDKSKIQWNFEGGEQIANEVEKWSNDGTTMIDMPKDGILQVFIPGIGNLQIEASSDFQKLWIWSLPGKDFVCIEPVMNDEGGLVKSPVMIPPAGTHESFMKISIS